MTDKTDALVALQNMKANGFDLELDEEDYLALDLAIEALAAPAASVDAMTLGQRAVATELLQCCESWEPGVRVMGNVKAGDAADLLRWLIDSAGGAKENNNGAYAPAAPKGGVVVTDDMVERAYARWMEIVRRPDSNANRSAIRAALTDLAADLAAAIARAEAAERDAARYRWLRDVWGRQIAIIGTSDCTFGVSTPSWRGAWLDFDAAIDAVMAPAIAAQQAEGEA